MTFSFSGLCAQVSSAWELAAGWSQAPANRLFCEAIFRVLENSFQSHTLPPFFILTLLFGTLSLEVFYSFSFQKKIISI